MSLRKNGREESRSAYTLNPSAQGYGDESNGFRDKTNRFIDSSADLVAKSIGWHYDYKRPAQKEGLKNN